MLLAASAAAGLSTPAPAREISVAQVLVACPDLAQAQACTGVAAEFLAGNRPGSWRNYKVVDLVVAIAEVAQQESVPRPVCLNAADGLRVLAGGVTDAERAGQISDI